LSNIKPQVRKSQPKSLNEIPSVASSQRSKVPILKNYSKTLNSLKQCSINSRPTILQESLSNFLDELSEMDFAQYKVKLLSEGRCTICTLKECHHQSQYASLSQIGSSKAEINSIKAREYSETNPIKESSRERINRLAKPKEYLDSIDSHTLKVNMAYMNSNLTRRRNKKNATIDYDQSVSRESVLTLDREREIKNKLLENQSTISNLLFQQKENQSVVINV